MVEFWRTPEIKGQGMQVVVANIEMAQPRKLEDEREDLSEAVLGEVETCQVRAWPLVDSFLSVVVLLEVGKGGDLI